MNPRKYASIQKDLLLAAEELDGAGHKDLADVIDRCNFSLEKAEDADARLITKVIAKVNREADLRTSRRSGAPSNRDAALRRRESIRRREREDKFHELARAKKLALRLIGDAKFTEEKLPSERNRNAMRMWRREHLRRQENED